MVAESIIGGVVGGIFRLAPEVLNWFDRKDARKHELEMQEKAYKFEELRGSQRMAEMEHETQQILDSGGLDALKEAIKAQAVMTGIKWVDAVNSTVRPFLTYWWCVFLFTAAKTCQFIALLDNGFTKVQAVNILWTPNEMAIVAGIINFWFLDRVIRKNKGL